MSPPQTAQNGAGSSLPSPAKGSTASAHQVEDVRRVPRQPQQCVGELPGGELADPFHTVFGGDPVRGRGALGQTESHRMKIKIIIPNGRVTSCQWLAASANQGWPNRPRRSLSSAMPGGAQTRFAASTPAGRAQPLRLGASVRAGEGPYPRRSPSRDHVLHLFTCRAESSGVD